MKSRSKMKFLACSQCISADPSHRPASQSIQEITNPLVVTKRPTPKPQHSQHQHHHHHHHHPKKKSTHTKRISPPASPTLATPSTSAAAASPSPPAAAATRKKKHRFPSSIFRSITLWSWQSRRRCYAQQLANHPTSVTMTKSKKNTRKTVRVIETPATIITSSSSSSSRRRLRNRSASTTNRTQRLIRLYEERAHSPEGRYRQCNTEFLLDPPPSFSGYADDSIESHQNFRNKLNTLDFKRMNTVALEEEPSTSTAGCSRSDSAIYKKNSYNEKEAESMPVHKYPRKTMLEDFLKERLKIEQTMIDLLNGQDPGSSILKKSKNEDKKVRFKVEQDAADKRCYLEDEDEKEISLDIVSDCDKKVGLKDADGKYDQETEIKLSLDPMTKVEDFYVEKRTTYLKGKTVEDKSLVLKIAPKSEQELEIDDAIGIGRGKEMVFYNFGKMSL